jgi:hypothetical protein
MMWGTGQHSGTGRGARALAFAAGLDAGLGWVPADGVSGRLAALAVAITFLVLVTDRPEPERRARLLSLDAASTWALLLTALAAAGAALVPPDYSAPPARGAWLVLASLAALLLLAANAPRPVGVATRAPEPATTGPRARR